MFTGKRGNMKQAPEHLVNLIEPIVEGMGYECVGVEYVPHGKNGLLRIYIDSESGILLDDCTRVSHQVSGVLDVEDPISNNYQLEVSSPGVDRPFFKLAQFEKYIGSQVQLNLFKPVNKKRRVIAQIKTIKDGKVQFLVDDELLEIPLSAMSKARLVPEYLPDKGKRHGE